MSLSFLIWTVFIALVVAAVVYAIRRPFRFSIERSIEIRAPRDRVLSLINNLRAWSGWAEQAGAATADFSGAESGKGAVMDWDGGVKRGRGRIEIIESGPSRVLVRLVTQSTAVSDTDNDQLFPETAAPARSVAGYEFLLEPRISSTQLTWKFSAESNGLMGVLGRVMSFERLAGDMLERQLARLKALAER